MSAEPTPSNPGPTWRGFLRALGRVVIFMLLLAVIVAALYFGVPRVYRDLVLPVRETSARLAALEESLSADRAVLLERLDDLQARLNRLEISQGLSGNDRASLQGEIADLRVDLEAFDQSLARLDVLESEIDSLRGWQSYAATQVMGMQDQFQSPSGDLGALRGEIARLKTLNLLTRAQVHLAQNNFGLAREDTLIARAVLLDLRAAAVEPESGQVDAWIVRLDLALANLPAFPVVAAGDLEQAYQLIAAAMLPAPAQAALAGTSTPTLALWLTETSAALTGTPTPIATFTPTPLRSSTATAIPNFTATPTP